MEQQPDTARGDITSWRGHIVAIVALIAVLYAAYHVIPAWLSRDSPPLACQLLGGHWSIRNGWRCG
jgi:hypothetical protein